MRVTMKFTHVNELGLGKSVRIGTSRQSLYWVSFSYYLGLLYMTYEFVCCSMFSVDLSLLLLSLSELST